MSAAALLTEFFESLLATPSNTKLFLQCIKLVREVVIVRLIVLDIRVSLFGKAMSDRGDLRINRWCFRTYSMVAESGIRQVRIYTHRSSSLEVDILNKANQ